jgi:hypothetical protein
MAVRIDLRRKTDARTKVGAARLICVGRQRLLLEAGWTAWVAVWIGTTNEQYLGDCYTDSRAVDAGVTSQIGAQKADVSARAVGDGCAAEAIASETDAAGRRLE